MTSTLHRLSYYYDLLSLLKMVFLSDIKSKRSKSDAFLDYIKIYKKNIHLLLSDSLFLNISKLQ
jgi:hypothetical protein